MRSVTAGLLFLMFTGLAGPTEAQTPTPVPQYPTSLQYKITPADAAKLLQATRDIETDRESKLIVVSKAATDMPNYDPLFHYAGIDPIMHVPVIWMSSNVTRRQADSEAKLAALELACMDSGLAGPWWKSLYDSLESYDAHLAVTQTNRYFSRLQLTASIQALIYKEEFGSH